MANEPATHAFPNDLAREVADRWSTLVAGDYVPPALPSLTQLRDILEVAYLAGLETDESRPLRFVLCCAPDSAPVPARVGATPPESWNLASDREFNVQEIRRIAAVTDLDSSAIWIRFATDGSKPPTIAGLLNLGRSWSVARNALSYHYDELPHALIVRVTAPRRIVIYQGVYRIAELAGGRLEAGTLATAWLDLMGLQGLFDEARDALRDLITTPRQEDPSEWNAFESLAYVNCILGIVNGIQLASHGGALILKSLRCDLVAAASIRMKYPISGGRDHVKTSFVDFMNLRHCHGDLVWNSNWNKELARPEHEIELSSIQLQRLQQKVARACTFVGRFAGTDGAIVMNTDLTVDGFGSEIVLERVKPARALEVNNPLDITGSVELDVEQMGMRHRSAIRLVATHPDLAVFVVSQDGGVSLVWGKGDDVYFKHRITTTNMNMLLA